MGCRARETEGKVTEDQRPCRNGSMRAWIPDSRAGGPLEVHLSQVESWLWLAAISRMSSISSSMRKGCWEVGSSSGHEYGLM